MQLSFYKIPCIKDRELEKAKKFLVFPWENYDVSIQENYSHMSILGWVKESVQVKLLVIIHSLSFPF